jgi:hypothetical protein
MAETAIRRKGGSPAGSTDSVAICTKYGQTAPTTTLGLM